MYIDKNNTVDGRTPAQVEVGSLSRYFFRSAEKKNFRSRRFWCGLPCPSSAFLVNPYAAPYYHPHIAA